MFNNKYTVLLKKYSNNLKLKFLFLCINLVLAIALKLYIPQLLRSFIDKILIGNVKNDFAMFASAYIVISIVQLMAVFLVKYLSEQIGWKASNLLRQDLLKSVMDKDLQFHKGIKTGEIIDRLDGDVLILKNFFSKMFVVVINNVLLIFCIVIILFKENIYMSIFQLVYILIAGVMFSKIQSVAVPHWIAIRKASNEMYGHVSEYIKNSEDIRTNNGNKYIINQFRLILDNWLPLRKKAIVMGYSTYITTILLVGLGNASSLLIGYFLWKNGSITIGTIYLFYSYTSLLAKPIDDIREQFVDFQKVGAAIERINDLLNTIQTISCGDKMNGIDQIHKLEVKDLSFGYDKLNPVINNINLSISSGRKVGIIGKTGCGKSTLAGLISKFYVSDNGLVTMNDIPINEFDNKYFRKKIAFISQKKSYL